MGTYRYTPISSEIPPIPIMAVQLTTPDLSDVRVDCQAILDTGSDCTLVPLTLIVRFNIKAADRAIQIPFAGDLTRGIPYNVGVIFDRYTHSKIRVFGCPVEALGEYLIIGRDLMNDYRIEFDGPEGTSTIF